MGKARRSVLALLLVGLTWTAAPALAQSGAGRALSSPGAPAARPSAVAPPAGYTSAPTGYGGARVPVVAPPERPPARPRRAADRRQKHVGNAVSVVGGAVFASSYLSMVLAGITGASAWTFVPVIGPFALIAEDRSADTPIIWADGFVQIAGAIALGIGLGLRFSFDDTPEDEAVLTPWIGPGLAGLGFTTRF